MIFGNKKPIEEPKAHLFEKELEEFRVKASEMRLEINTLVRTFIADENLFNHCYSMGPSSYSLDKARVFLFKKAYRGKTMNNELAFYCSLELQKMIDSLQEGISEKKNFLKEKPTVENLSKLKDDARDIYSKFASEGNVTVGVCSDDDSFREYSTTKEIAYEYMYKIRGQLGKIIDDLNKEKESIVCFNDHVADLKSFKQFVEVLIKK